MKNNIFLIFICFILAFVIQTVYAKQGIRILTDKKMYHESQLLVNRERAVVVDCMKLEYVLDKGGLSTEFLDLKWPEQNQHILLRNKPKMVNEKGYQEIIYRYNFNDTHTHSNGCFRNKFKSSVRFRVESEKDPRSARLDQVTNLMWLTYDSKNRTFQKTAEALDAWNKKSYGGYSDWRMPTLDEAASLYTKYGHTKRGWKSKFWIADTFHDDELHWVGNLRINTSYLDPLEEKRGNKAKKLKLKLLMVRNQPPPYPIKPSEINLADQLCDNWEQYHSLPRLIKKPLTPEWPDKIRAKKLRVSPFHYKNQNMDTYTSQGKLAKFYKESIEFELSQIGFGFLNGHFKCFQNYYIDINSDVVVDLATNLMWQKGVNRLIEKYNNMIVKEEYITQLNKDKFNGFDNWRIPTTPEVSSLIEMNNYGKNKIHLNQVFSTGYTSFNVIDKFSFVGDTDNEKSISVNAGSSSGIGLDFHRNPLKETIKAVRTLTKEEVQAYCKQKGVTCQ